MYIALANNPNAKLTARSMAKILKAGNVAEAWPRGKALHPFPFESFYEPLMRSDRFCKKSCSLLPFAFFGDVGIVAPAKSENGQQVRLGIEIVSQPRPSGKISGG